MRFLPLFALAASFQLGLSAQTVRVLGLQPTALFPKAEPLRQIAILKIENSDKSTQEVDVELIVNGQHLTQHAKLDPGCEDLKVLIPDITSPAPLELRILTGEGAARRELAHWNQTWQPQRKWTIFIVKSSHEDLGYEGTIYQKTHDNANWIDIGKRLSDPKMIMGGDRFHYNIETLVGARDYITERGEIAWRDLVETEIKTGHMSLLGAPSGVHSHWMDYEELARMTYPAQREMKDRYGLDFPTFMIVDNPSLSWSGAQVLADAGFRYVARWGQGWRSGGNNDYAHTKVPAVFWWVGPDGQHKVLFAWRSHYDIPLWYGQGNVTQQQIQDVAAPEVSKSLKSIEDGSALGPYPYDAVVFPQYYDHEIPHAYHGLLPYWSSHFAYPVIKMADPTEFFQYIEEHFGSEIPTLSGDLNNFSADYATIDPESQGWKRVASREIPFAEGMQAVASYLDPTVQPTTDRVARDYTRLFDYDEHSWPTQPNAEDLHVFNANFVKRETARRVNADGRALLQEELAAVGSHIPVDPNGRSVAVWNSLIHPSDGPVVLKGQFGTMIDATNGERILTQRTDDGNTVMVANGVPAYGYKIYRESSQVSTPAINDSGDTIENEFYRVRLDSHTGNIVSITDKRQNRELVDPNAPYQFNQFVFIHKNARDSLAGTEHKGGPAQSVERVRGSVFQEIRATIEDAETGAEIVETVRLYKGVPRIDLIDTVRHAKAMFDTSSADRYKDNIFFAFPVNVPGGQARAEYPGGVVRPFIDQLRWGSHDYLSANRWVDVSTSQQGVTIAPWNEQIFHFGEIRYNQFSVNYKPSKPHLFGYAWSNRMTGLLDLDNNHPEFTVRYSVGSHNGDWNSGQASQLGWRVASPLTPIDIQVGGRGLDPKSQSLLSVDASNVEITVLKQSEQPGRGWIVRLVETAGRETDVMLHSSLLPVDRAWETSIAEEDRSTLPTQKASVRLHLLPFGMKTIRLQMGGVGEAPSNVKAVAVSGEKVKLTWDPQEGQSYNIFRSQDPRDPPTAQTLIARTTGSEFLDDHLMPMGTYYYHVAAVNANNVESPVSPTAQVVTQSKNQEPPPAVSDLVLIALTGHRRMVAWEKSTAADVREYRVYRSVGEKFDAGNATLVNTQAPSGYSIETFLDQSYDPEKKYQYFVVPVDWAGNYTPLQ